MHPVSACAVLQQTVGQQATSPAIPLSPAHPAVCTTAHGHTAASTKGSRLSPALRASKAIRPTQPLHILNTGRLGREPFIELVQRSRVVHASHRMFSALVNHAPFVHLVTMRGKWIAPSSPGWSWFSSRSQVLSSKVVPVLLTGPALSVTNTLEFAGSWLLQARGRSA